MGRHLSPRYGQVILVSGYPVLTAVNWSQHWCAICVQYQSSCAPKLARKCEIEHWLPCGADGRAVYGHVITKFSGMGRFTYPWGSAGALRAPEIRYKIRLKRHNFYLQRLALTRALKGFFLRFKPAVWRTSINRYHGFHALAKRRFFPRFSSTRRKMAAFIKPCLQYYFATGFDTVSCEDYEEYEFLECVSYNHISFLNTRWQLVWVLATSGFYWVFDNMKNDN